jgi:uncharacterized membrane protein YqhA
MFMFGILVMVIQVASIDNRELTFVLTAIGVLLAAGLSVVVLFGSKVYFVMNGADTRTGSQWGTNRTSRLATVPASIIGTKTSSSAIA